MHKILVIEDDELIREGIVEILEFEDYEVVGAGDGIQGLKLAQAFQPDLILCDVMMPGLDGHEVLARLRKVPDLALTPFIFLTAKSTTKDVRQGMDGGADDYLAKPVRSNDLLRAVRTRLDRKLAMAAIYASDLRRIKEQLDYVLYYDNITGLPNRLMLREKLALVLDESEPNATIVPILMVSLDRFRRISENFGQDHSDRILKEVTERILDCVDDHDVVAKLDKDDFVVILAAVDAKAETHNVAQCIAKEIAKPFCVDNHEVRITASIGVAFHPQHGVDMDTLIRNAATAQNNVKQKDDSLYYFYNPKLGEGLTEQLELQSHLFHALDRDEFQLYFQPQISLVTGQIIGAEALLRWYHPKYGIISPAKFIPLAEESGAIETIGEWVIREACRQAKTWQKISIPNSTYSPFSPEAFYRPQISVNLSARQFKQEDLSSRIVRIVEECELEPSLLEIEVTESSLIDDISGSIAKMHELKSIGIQISIDDFGTGYSSLSYLKQFPFDTLKIDRCFIHDLAHDQENRAIAKAIIQMAHSLNLHVIAEGVETMPELNILKQNSCNAIQGYIFSRPVPAEEFRRLLHAGKCMEV
ncbi:response regulator receiver modulated diguanylate cyclase/phosphodiesterase [Thalassoporum mexicanum PCC 7367]|uniref:putative bifunctional diguanylate cyclase/phosphodiesterase n=1 Tax=Thalassoporum mexicanum TaxID=3457544 RepID=UPI00029F85D2|nr:EAL domain-containing response regulator [Pseudanabaena sp. PCC 7367]AFY71150.1 response regulator receiver modulated diguanylate cyclase/phosphodiesterase [Pseudanabaena sp. PCC 7367]